MHCDQVRYLHHGTFVTNTNWETEAKKKKKLSLYCVQQTLIFKVSRHGLTLGKKGFTFSQSSESSQSSELPLEVNNVLLQLKWVEQQ